MSTVCIAEQNACTVYIVLVYCIHWPGVPTTCQQIAGSSTTPRRTVQIVSSSDALTTLWNGLTVSLYTPVLTGGSLKDFHRSNLHRSPSCPSKHLIRFTGLSK